MMNGVKTKIAYDKISEVKNMTSVTIIEIEKQLKKRRDEAKSDYHIVRQEIQKRYNTENIENKMQECERKILNMAYKDYAFACNMYQDFISHEW